MDTVKTIDTPYTNAVATINKLNSLFSDNNVLDSSGTEIARLDINPTNPGWLFALACGSLHTSWQEQLAKAYACLDSQNCEEDQVLVLASLAGLVRGNGTPSHIMVELTNLSASQVTIPLGTQFSESIANQTWALNQDVTLEATGDQDGNDKATVTLYTTDDGAFDVPSGTDFTNEDYPDVTCSSESQSAGGTNIESIASLRNRISQGTETADFKTQAENAIALLSGIESCTIWFNGNLTQNLVVGDKTIPPRTCYVSIKGVDVSGKVAETYFTYLDVPATVGSESEAYIRGQQQLTMNFDYAQGVTVPIWVKIRSADAAVGAEAAIQEKILSYSGTMECGQNLTSQQVSEWIQNLGYGTVIGCNVATQTGLMSDINPDEYCVFTKATITVTQVDEYSVS